LTGLGSAGDFGLAHQSAAARRGFSDRFGAQSQGNPSHRSSRRGSEEIKSERLSSNDSEGGERDPKKLYTSVSTILMSFAVPDKKKPAQQLEDKDENGSQDQQLMTILESQEADDLDQSNQSSTH